MAKAKAAFFDEAGKKRRPEPGMVLLKAPAELAGSGVEGQTIGSDLTIEIDEQRAEALCRDHGFTRVKAE